MNAGFSFNPMDPQLLADPYPIFRWMREEDPIHRSDLGFWVMTRHEDCRHVLIDKTFGQGDFVKNIQLFYDADFDVLAHPAYIWLSRVFVMQDPPTHTRLRGWSREHCRSSVSVPWSRGCASWHARCWPVWQINPEQTSLRRLPIDFQRW